MDKTEFRKMIKGNMKSVFIENPLYRSAESEKICKKIISSSIYSNADVILGFMPLKDEVDISEVLVQCFKDKKKVAVPRIIPDTNKMDFYYIEEQDLIDGMENGSFGIMEPEVCKKLFVLQELAVEKENLLILVPGLGFTKSGLRMGRGKGFYDRFLGELTNENQIKNLHIKINTLGVCFPFQILDNLPVEEKDIKIDSVIF